MSSLEDRFNVKFLISTTEFYDGTPCHPWVGSSCRARYVDPLTGVYPRRGNIFVPEFQKNKLATHVVVFLTLGFWPAQVNHLCNNPLCVNFIHFEVYQQRQAGQTRNINYMVAQGRARPNALPGARKANSIIRERSTLTPDKIRAIRSAEGSHASIATKFQCAKSTVTNVRNYKAWAHIPDPHVVQAESLVVGSLSLG